MKGESLEALEARTRALLASDRLSGPTRRVLLARLDVRFGPPQALDGAEMATLQALCLRLVPEPELVARTELAQALEARWAARTPKGWRYRDAPDDLTLVRLGLKALIAAGFTDQPPQDQDRLIAAIADGAGPFDGEPRLQRWFEEVMSAVTEIYYAHPLVQVAIGYDGMADQGPLAIGLDAVAKEARIHGG